jgi:hypothetical protein
VTVTEPLDIDIVQLARSNDAFRRGIATGERSQLVAQTKAEADAAEAAEH